MRILGLEINRSSNTTIPKLNSEKRSILSDYLSYGSIPYNTSTTTVTSESSLTISSVWKAVNLISDSIAQLPLEPYKKGANGIWKVDKQHPSYNLLNVEPHPLYNKFNFWKTMIANISLHGNAYAYIVRDTIGNPINFIYLYPPEVEVYINEETNEHKYKIIDKPGFIDPQDMIHLLNYSKNGYTGVSTIHYGSRSMGIAIASDKNAAGFFTNGGNMSGIIKVDGRLTPGQAQSIKSAWQTAFSPTSDSGNSGGVAILETGMEYQGISIDPQTAQLLESRKWNVEEVARWFNVPGSKLGITTGLNYNSIESNNLEFLQTTLAPIITQVELELQRKLFRPSVRSSVVAKFNEDALLRVDLESKVTYLSKLTESGLMSLNEGREKLGLEPVEGGDTIIVKSGYQPLDKLLSGVETNKLSTLGNKKEKRK